MLVIPWRTPLSSQWFQIKCSFSSLRHCHEPRLLSTCGDIAVGGASVWWREHDRSSLLGDFVLQPPCYLLHLPLVVWTQVRCSQWRVLAEPDPGLVHSFVTPDSRSAWDSCLPFFMNVLAQNQKVRLVVFMWFNFRTPSHYKNLRLQGILLSTLYRYCVKLINFMLTFFMKNNFQNERIREKSNLLTILQSCFWV